MYDGVTKGRRKDLGGAAELGDVVEKFGAMCQLAGALAGEDVGLRFRRPARWGWAEVGVCCTVCISLG